MNARILHAVTLSLAVSIAIVAFPDSGYAAPNGSGSPAKGSVRNGGGAAPGGPSVSPGGVGGAGSSYGSGAMSNERAGYLHGRAVPEPGTNPDDGASGGSATDAATSSFQNTSDSCRDFVPATQGLSARMERRNVARFRRAESMMEKGARQGGDADYLIASYQEELAKPEPDLLLAGTYLGLVSNEPMTASTIERLSQALCVPVSHEQALGIARAAEGQRRSMRH